MTEEDFTGTTATGEDALDLGVPEDVLKRIQKLLNMADIKRNSSEAEALVAQNKANELLIRYNLTAAAVERSSGIVDGKREDLKVQGGFYVFQRDLWNAIARLNFCLYWTQEYEAIRDKTIVRKGRTYHKGSPVIKCRHRLVGRIINTTATRNMAEYLQGAIERLVRDWMHANSDGTVQQLGPNGEKPKTINLWDGYCIGFREGAANRIIEKIEERREKLVNAERKKQAAARRAQAEAETKGMSNSTAITLSAFSQTEEDANQDFIHGEGWSAEQRRQQQEDAAEAKREREAYTAWAKANPEEAKAREERARKRRRYYGRAPRERNVNWGGYSAGKEAGKSISLEPQMNSGGQKKIGGRK